MLHFKKTTAEEEEDFKAAAVAIPSEQKTDFSSSFRSLMSIGGGGRGGSRIFIQEGKEEEK